MKRALRYIAWVLVAVLIVALGAYFWAYQVATQRYETQWNVHKVDFPIPFPLGDDEIAALRAERRRRIRRSGRRFVLRAHPCHDGQHREQRHDECEP